MLLSQPVRPTTGEGEAISPRLEKPLATSLDIFKECGQIAGQIHQAASLVTADTIRFDGGLAVVDWPFLSRNAQNEQEWISRACLSDGNVWVITLQAYQTPLQKRLRRSSWRSFL
jgi:hypothetical protein